MHAALVARPGSCIRRLGGVRAGEVRFTRWLRNASVTAREIAAHAGEGTARRVVGRDVVAIQDTSELILGGRRKRAQGFGPVGRGGALGGILLHPVLAVEAGTGALLGLVDVQVWNREGGAKVGARRGRATADKESRRWVEGMARAGEVLAPAAGITVVADRESDIYELFARRPSNVHLVVRAAQDRCIEAGAGPGVEGPAKARLFAYSDGLPERGRLALDIPAAPGRKARQAELAVRFSPVVLRKPRHGAAGELPETVTLTLVDIRETSRPADGKPVHWRLLTSHAVRNLGEARRVRDLYRQRWTIEEFFRTLKKAGFDIEGAEIGDPRAMINFAAATTVAAVTVMQLVQAREGTTDQGLGDAFEADDQAVLEALSAQLEGKTARQKNPHSKASLAFAAWVIARLGGWTGYYGKPGPLVMRRGLDDFQRIKYGATLELPDV